MKLQDGTINYLTLPAVTNGLRFLKPYLPFIPLRLTSLLHYLISSLESLRHEESGVPVVQVLSRRPSSRLALVGEQSDVGGVISLSFQGVSLGQRFLPNPNNNNPLSALWSSVTPFIHRRRSSKKQHLTSHRMRL